MLKVLLTLIIVYLCNNDNAALHHKGFTKNGHI